MDTGKQLQPGHAAVNSKVEWIGETHEGVDDMNDVASEIIVHLGVDAKVMLSENIYNVTEFVPVWKSVEDGDHHEWDLCYQEDGYHRYQHQCCSAGISSVMSFLDQRAPTGF